MEDNKKVYKFFGKSGEDFHLWLRRTEAALEGKDVLHIIQDVHVSPEPLADDVRKEVAIARATVIQGLGDRQLRIFITVKDRLTKIWTRLRDRYAVSNTATKVQLQTRLSTISHNGSYMQD